MRSRIKRGVGQSGGDDFEAYPGREEFAAGEEGAARWPEQMLAHADFSDAGIEVRSMDYRHRKVGLFGDFLSRRWQLRWLRRSSLYKATPTALVRSHAPVFAPALGPSPDKIAHCATSDLACSAKLGPAMAAPGL